ncbi:MAG: (deoxy)nucleoside triphosphate pyrophosphohydrolase [Atopobiaceae bacterium]|nr:(deoxy)nucleoside triphosphate pyrophosphohydrolase [Atopobiaceae bacterium]
MKTYHVVAAIIRRNGKILATQRGYGEYKDGWEFPGGKIEPGETPEEALVREIREELAMDIAVERHVTDVAYDYPTFHLEMACFLCGIVEGTPHLLEHEAARWLAPEAIDSVDWLPADVLVVDALKEQGAV